MNSGVEDEAVYQVGPSLTVLVMQGLSQWEMCQA